MSHRGPTYVIFDGDEDGWAYQYMRGWKANDNVDFDFRDAHDLDGMTGRAQNEQYVKQRLRERMMQARSVLVLVGDKTKYLYKYIRWEIELALELGLPIVVAYLNGSRNIDSVACPPILRDQCAIHIPFKMAAIKETLNVFPPAFAGMTRETKAEGPRHYNAGFYRDLGL